MCEFVLRKFMKFTLTLTYSMSVSISTTVYSWLRELKIPVSKTYLKQQLHSHPDYRSLLSITDTLDELGIENAAVQIQKDQLHEVPTPFLAHLNGYVGEFVVVKNRDNVEQQFPGFYERWGGVIVSAEKSLNWSHKENNEQISKDSKTERTLVLTLCIFAIFILFSNILSFHWAKAGLMLIAAAGIFVSWMIVSKDLGIENKIADQVCGKDADCNSVIHSKITKLPFNFGWSDTGIIYFPFLLMTLLITSFNSSLAGIYFLLGLFATVGILFTLISVYYQGWVIKKWCRLCLITGALLWLQVLVLMPQTSTLFKYGFVKIAITDVTLVSFILFIITSTWSWLKQEIKKNKKLEAENFAAKRFRRNPNIFNSLLEKQKKLNVNPEDLGIVLGNPAASNTIIKICNPYCHPCAKAHTVIDKLLEENSNLKVQILFKATDDDKDIKAKPVKHLMALNEKNNTALMQRALNDWYLADKKDYDSFAGKYVLNGELENQGARLSAMKDWCEKMKIGFTPTFFVNGYQLPQHYSIEELKYFLDKGPEAINSFCFRETKVKEPGTLTRAEL